MKIIHLKLTELEYMQLLSCLKNDYSENDAESCRAITRIVNKIHKGVK